MKANELSIGDWVCAKMTVINGEERLTPPMRVVVIGETWVQLRIDPEAGDPDEYGIEDIRPIPLTVPILLVNGWGWEHPKKLWRFFDSYSNIPWAESVIWNDGRLHFELRTQQAGIKNIFNSVHELQHAMRLAGIEKEILL